MSRAVREAFVRLHEDGIEGGSTGSDWPLVLLFGVGIGTACYLAWQLSALAVRQLLVWCSDTGFSQGWRR